MARRDRVDVFWGTTGLIPLIGVSACSVLSVHYLVAPNRLNGIDADVLVGVAIGPLERCLVELLKNPSRLSN
jgi:hypothetical protein